MIFFTDDTMAVTTNGKTELIELNSPLGKELLDLYKTKDFEGISEAIMRNKLLDGVSVKEGENGFLEVEGVLMHPDLANKVREFKRESKPFDYLIRLAEKIDQIDSLHVREQIYAFLQHNGHPITSEGNFIAYKKVTDDFKDLHTGKFDNSIGSIVSMNRRDCDDRPDKTCSRGLHVASHDYAHNFGSGKLVLCEVDPRDVVAVPVDYNQKKMRTCRYAVVGLAEKLIEEATFDKKGDDPNDIEEGDLIEWNNEEYEVVGISCYDAEVRVDLEGEELEEFNVNITNDYFKFL